MFQNEKMLYQSAAFKLAPKKVQMQVRLLDAECVIMKIGIIAVYVCGFALITGLAMYIFGPRAWREGYFFWASAKHLLIGLALAFTSVILSAFAANSMDKGSWLGKLQYQLGYKTLKEFCMASQEELSEKGKESLAPRVSVIIGLEGDMALNLSTCTAHFAEMHHREVLCIMGQEFSFLKEMGVFPPGMGYEALFIEQLDPNFTVKKSK